MKSLKGRLVLSHVGLAFVLIIILGFLLVFFLESQVILINLSTQLNRQAALLAEISADYPQVWIDQNEAEVFVERFGSRIRAQFMLLDPEGRVLASSDENDNNLLGQRLSHPDLALVQTGQVSNRTDYSQDIQAEIADIMVPVLEESGNVIGMIRLTHQLSTTQERFQRLRSIIAQILTVGLVLGVALAFILAWQLEKPVDRLTKAIYRLASGEDLTAIPIQGPTELRLLAKGFNNLVERLNILRIARRQLISNLVHELGRPLGALRLANQALLDGAVEEPEFRNNLLRGTETELKSLQKTLNDLVEYYDHGSNDQKLDIQPTPLSNWLSYLEGPWAQAAKSKNLNWKTNIPPGLPIMSIDPERLAQAIGNLIENAIKYTPSGGEISFDAGQRLNEVWIRVSDTGQGISLDDQPHIFDPFYRSKASDRIPEGMGLGLTITKDLIIAHQGRLEFKSEAGVGSQFIIWLAST